MFYAAAVVCLASFCSLLVVGEISGVQDTHLAYYSDAKAADLFRCFDGQKELPFSKVNDNYCDCADGSDEPGTSACQVLVDGRVTSQPTNWMFKCAENGVLSMEISHSYVGDGICDCCDGSDEKSGLISCPNTCVKDAENIARRHADEEMIRKEAEKVKADMTTLAKSRRELAAKSVPELERELEDIVAETPKLKEIQSQTEEMEELERRRIKEKHSEWKRKKAERIGVDVGSLDLTPVCISWRQTGKCRPSGPREPSKDKSCTEVVPASVSGYCECLVTKPVSVASADIEPVASGSAQGTVYHNFSCHHKELSCEYVCINNGQPGVGVSEAPPDDGSTYQLPEASEARSNLERHMEKFRARSESLQRTKTLLSTSFGTADLLRTLDQSCFTLESPEYTYELCPFNVTRQVSHGSSYAVMLGKWSSFANNTYSLWSKDALDYSLMLYTDGDRCWSGASRSTDVQIVCGPKNQLTHIEEPSMCKYRMVFETPAIC